jgi:hypothetical protein
LVEHCTENAGVGGSIPPLGTITNAFRQYCIRRIRRLDRRTANPSRHHCQRLWNQTERMSRPRCRAATICVRVRFSEDFHDQRARLTASRRDELPKFVTRAFTQNIAARLRLGNARCTERQSLRCRSQASHLRRSLLGEKPERSPWRSALQSLRHIERST